MLSFSVATVLFLPLSYYEEGLEATDKAPWGAIIENTDPIPLGFSSCLAMKYLKEGRQPVNGLESRPESLQCGRQRIGN